MNDTLNRRSFAALSLASTAALLAGCAHPDKPFLNEQGGTRTGKRTQVAILLYPGTTVLDWIGPYEALHRVEGVDVILAAKTTELMKSDSGIVDYKANVTLDEVKSPDILLVPGGAQGLMVAANDPVTAEWVKQMDETSSYTVGICTGSLLLAKLGLLDGRRATTYWKFSDMLGGGGATFVPERWVQDGKYWTSAGVSAGMDLTLALIADLYGTKAAMMAQLAIEYDPHPPFNAGSIRTAPKAVVDALGGEPATRP